MAITDSISVEPIGILEDLKIYGRSDLSSPNANGLHGRRTQSDSSLLKIYSKEMKEMEDAKAEIDRLAEIEARREMWFLVVFLIIKDVVLMYLTFWVYSWKKMKPIYQCIILIYFIVFVFYPSAGEELSVGGLYNRRFATKQMRLMKERKFDSQQFDKLKKRFGC